MGGVYPVAAAKVAKVAKVAKATGPRWVARNTWSAREFRVLYPLGSSIDNSIRSNLEQGKEIIVSQADPATMAVETAPVVSGRPEEVAPGVFVIPDRRTPLVPNIGVIVGERAALVIDTGMGPRNGAIVRDVARELAGERPLFLTLTHFHPEHGYGAQAFRDATIIYNRAQYEELRDKGLAYLQMFRGLGEGVTAQLEGVELVSPHVAYAAADLDLGGKVVQLRTWGPAHTRGDQAVLLPAESALFTGDLVENRFFPIFPLLSATRRRRRWPKVDRSPRNVAAIGPDDRRSGPRRGWRYQPHRRHARLSDAAAVRDEASGGRRARRGRHHRGT
jgi:glyoxylase-like metal-dependent hydrolase (beta-lactamase superfamily II)